MSQTVSIARYERERAARKEAERLLEEKSRALYLANTDLSETLVRLQDAQSQLIQNEKMASIGQMAAGVAHEINNPIGFVSSNLDSLKQYIQSLAKVIAQDDKLLEYCKALPDLADMVMTCTEVREAVDLAFVLEDLTDLVAESIEGTQRVKRIVSDLKDFSHVDQPEMAAVELHAVIDKTLMIAANEIKYKAEVVREYGQVPAVYCYGGKIGQVILNLLVNAAQAIDTRGTITVRTGHAGINAWFEVQDTGVGIPSEVMPKIYDPFFTTKPVGQGTGLGLHMVHKIVEAHQGAVQVESVLGTGTTIRVTLPIDGVSIEQHADNKKGM